MLCCNVSVCHFQPSIQWRWYRWGWGHMSHNSRWLHWQWARWSTALMSSKLTVRRRSADSGNSKTSRFSWSLFALLNYYYYHGAGRAWRNSCVCLIHMNCRSVCREECPSNMGAPQKSGTPEKRCVSLRFQNVFNALVYWSSVNKWRKLNEDHTWVGRRPCVNCSCHQSNSPNGFNWKINIHSF